MSEVAARGNPLGNRTTHAILKLKVSEMMHYDYNKRSYLLPPGCKDLIDLLNLQEQKGKPSIELPFISGDFSIASSQDLLGAWKLKKKKPNDPPAESPDISFFREVVIPHEILVLELSKIADQKPFTIIADLMDIGIFASVNQMLGFEVASRVLKKYGIIAKKAA